MTSNVPSLYQVLQLIQDNGLEGEQDTSLVVLLSTVRGGFLIMYGPSSAGKDEVVESAVGCYPNEGEDELFKIPNSTSPTVLFEKAKEANAANIHLYPDSTDLPEHIESLIKSNAEGRAQTHEWTEMAGGRHLEGREINAPDCIIYPWASNNEGFDINENAEFRNRALIVSVDASKEQTERVNSRQALEASHRYEPNLSPEESQEVRSHVGTIRGAVARYGRKNSMGAVLNPCMTAIDAAKPLPQHFPEARRDFLRLKHFMESVALYYHSERQTSVDKHGNPVLLATPADCWYAMRIFGEKMILSALNLSDIDREILALFRENPGTGYSASELQQLLRGAGQHVSDTDVNRALKGMKHKGYVIKQKGSSGVNEWSAGPFASSAQHQSVIDWQAVVDETKENVRYVLSEDAAEEYIRRFCQGEGLMVTDPFSGEVANITEDTTIQDAIDEATDGMNEVVESPLGESSPTEPTEPEAPEVPEEDEEPEAPQGLAAYARGSENVSEGAAGTLR